MYVKAHENQNALSEERQRGEVGDSEGKIIELNEGFSSKPWRFRLPNKDIYIYKDG